jgi:UDP-N-acetylmuramate dehydrogenase
MILVVSTSSSLTSFAVFDEGRLVMEGSREAPRAASGALCSLIEESGLDLSSIRLFVADTGPGSFMGVKVGVAMAKMWALAGGAQVAGVSAFDLVEGGGDAIPARTGQVYRRTEEGPVMEEGEAEPVRVLASCAAGVLSRLEPMPPEALSPSYGALPNVSVPKNARILTADPQEWMNLFPEGRRDEPLSRWTTLRSGGPAELLVAARSLDHLRRSVVLAHRYDIPLTVLGWGSNVLPSESGLSGLVVINQAEEYRFADDGTVTASTGISFQEVFLKAAQRGLSGLEFAVGIPGTLGGALVSNAGAYRSGIGTLVTDIEVVDRGEVRWTSPEILQLSYRDSILRRPNPPRLVVTQVRLKLSPAPAKAIYDAAREFQRQRIGKQPAPASAGSFFKNVVDKDLAAHIPGLTEGMRASGVIPAGFLLEQVGFKGRWGRGARFHWRHANFMTNVGQASPGAIRDLAGEGAAAVKARFGVDLEEEVLYLGGWEAISPPPLESNS